MTVAQIDAELDAIHDARLKLLDNIDRAISYTVGGRQVTTVGPSALMFIDRHEAWLENKRTRQVEIEAGRTGGMRVRYGAVR
jgi:multidrug efflux pump subunit AcrA (membrane-fusion protein)